MRYPDNHLLEPIYTQSTGLHHMLLFTVVLGFVIGLILFWLGRRGRVLWLTVWSAGLVLISFSYVLAYLAGWIQRLA